MIDGVLGVVKAYTTRVGDGPAAHRWPSRQTRSGSAKVGGEFGSVTGRPRSCGWFDAPAVRYAARVNGLTALAVTKLDVLDGFDRIPVGTGYEVDGAPARRCRPRSRCWSGFAPCIETLPGWERSHRRGALMADLPKAAPGLPRPAAGAGRGRRSGM